MLGCNPVDIPMFLIKRIGQEKRSTQEDRGRYERFVGRLIYLSYTRLILVLNQYRQPIDAWPNWGTHRGCVKDFEVPQDDSKKRITLQKTSSLGHSVILFYFIFLCRLTEDVKDKRSTSRYCSYVLGQLGCFEKQKSILSLEVSAETEFRPFSIEHLQRHVDKETPEWIDNNNWVIYQPILWQPSYH